MIRSILSVVGGLVAAGIVVFIVETIGQKVNPLPSDFQMESREELENYISKLPLSVIILVLVGWLAGAFAGGMVTTLIDQPNGRRNSSITGGIFLLVCIANLFMIPSPLWMWIATLLLVVPMVLLGKRVIRRRL